jgi:RimJ/RimL family protein N-acetyltransferase
MMKRESDPAGAPAIVVRQFDPEEGETLIQWLASDRWPFHRDAQPDPVRLAARMREGFFASADTRTFWILDAAGERVGLIRIMDFTDEVPVFDLRIRTAHRRRGFGTQALRWLAAYLFDQPDKIRIEGHTRQDNRGMRRLFRRCGWVKEAHFRRVWPTADGDRRDSIGYGLLKSDWEQGTVTPVEWDDE